MKVSIVLLRICTDSLHMIISAKQRPQPSSGLSILHSILDDYKPYAPIAGLLHPEIFCSLELKTNGPP